MLKLQRCILLRLIVSEKNFVLQEPPPSIQELVAKDNSKIDAWVKGIKEMQVRE